MSLERRSPKRSVRWSRRARRLQPLIAECQNVSLGKLAGGGDSQCIQHVASVIEAEVVDDLCSVSCGGPEYRSIAIVRLVPRIGHPALGIRVLLVEQIVENGRSDKLGDSGHLVRIRKQSKQIVIGGPVLVEAEEDEVPTQLARASSKGLLVPGDPIQFRIAVTRIELVPSRYVKRLPTQNIQSEEEEMLLIDTGIPKHIHTPRDLGNARDLKLLAKELLPFVGPEDVLLP